MSLMKRFAGVVLAGSVMLMLTSTASASSWFRSQARLFGPTALKGKVTYEQRPRQGTTEQRFKVEVERGVPLQVLQVRVNGNLVGSITVNSFGRGKLQLRTAQFIDSPGDGTPISAGFPRLDTGDVVTVGPLSGVFFDRIDTSVQRFRLEGRTNNGNATDAKARYEERFKNGGLMRRFDVEIEDAGSNQSFPIFVKNQQVATVTTNQFGFVEFQLRTAAFIDSPGDGQPMPATFPSLRAGDQVRIGSMTVTLQPD